MESLDEKLDCDFEKSWKLYYACQASIEDAYVEKEILKQNKQSAKIIQFPPEGNQWVGQDTWFYCIEREDDILQLKGKSEKNEFKLRFINNKLQLYTYQGNKQEVLHGIKDLLKSFFKKKSDGM